MTVDPRIVGNCGSEGTVRWDARDALLYALAIGAGSSPDHDELAFTVDEATDVVHTAIPSMILVLRAGDEPDMGDLDQRTFLHAEQALKMYKPLPVAGSLRVKTCVTDVWDKGAGALIVRETRCVDVTDGQLLATLTDSLFVRGGGGFGGPPQPRSTWQPPERPADVEVCYDTGLGQALLYRLTGDRNPIHADPAIAQQAGFGRPILHGMCTYGFAARALLNTVARGDASRLRSMSARFTSTVVPGDRLSVSVWSGPTAGYFRVSNQHGTVVLDRGTYELR